MKRLGSYPLYKYIFAASDWLLLAASFVLAERLATGWRAAGDAPADFFTAQGILTLLICSFGAIMVFQALDLYKINVILSVAQHIPRLLAGTVLAVAGFSLVASFATPLYVHDSKLTILLFAAVAFAAALLVRVLLLRSLLHLFSQLPMARRRLLIVGAGTTGRKAAVIVFLHRHLGLDLVGFLDDAVVCGTPVFGGAKVIGTTADLERVVRSNDIREVLICEEGTDHHRIMEIVERAAVTAAVVKISSPLYQVVPARVFTEHYGELAVVNATQPRPGLFKEKYKRVFDIVAGSAALFLLAPLFAVIILAITLDSPGPVFYLQTRIGRHGRPFRFFKFRSMRVGSDRDERRKHLIEEMIRRGDAVELMEKGTTKIVDKSSVTAVGAWLRRTSLDELPQLFNVIKGDMSLVGPRPCLPYEWEAYEEWHKKRLTVLPGCTGVWQVSGRSSVGFREMVVLDLYYIQNVSLAMDLKLILKTIPVMLFSKGGA